MRAVFTTLVLAASALAAPLVLEKRGCNPMPSKVDPNIRDIVYKTVKDMGGNDHVMLATMSAAITESLVNNLRCGDKDSQGIFQQRPSMGWGSVAQITDPVYSTKAFLKVLIPLEKSHPNTDAGVLAQMVQNAEAGNQYTKNLSFAKQLIAEAAKSVGDSAPATQPTKTADPAPKPTKTVAVPINAAPKPTASKPAQADDNADDEDDDEDCDDDEDDSAPQTPINVAPAPGTGSSASCPKTYTPKKGDNCYKLADMFGIKLSTLYKLNPQIDSECHNLQINQAYCVSDAASA
ncbi:hypothetical protein AURDEDRAFT_111751 [Auricularia subglabra TFB-10046 SS5]|nr:hypothetical protein AURDEDRAFT_111751 [Auricularia subglabra TFB-10046 SS5]